MNVNAGETRLSPVARQDEDIITLSATEIARLVAAGDLSAETIVEVYYRRIAQVDGRVGAWVSLNREYAIEQAQSVDNQVRIGGSAGSLAGVPFGVKDVINTVVLPTKMGSPIWERHNAGNDARVVSHLRWEGAVVAGKTVTAEFAVHEPGRTRNPHDLLRTPGTSSSGSAAAVATAMVPFALGTQTSGSLIRPASFCGIYAFKPTFGWVPRTGVLKTTDTLDQIGFHARHVVDLRLLFEVARVKGRDHVLKERLLKRFPDKKKWRVGLLKTHLWHHAPQYAQEALVGFANDLRSRCVEVVETRLPDGFDTAHEIHGRIYDSDLSYYFRKEACIDPEQMSVQLRAIVDNGKRISPETYRIALEQQVNLSEKLDNLFDEKGLDILLSLSSNGEAPAQEPIPFRDPCAIFTMCGVPTMSLPVFRSPRGLPFGAQVTGRKYSDYVLLSFVEHLASEEVLNSAAIAEPR